MTQTNEPDITVTYVVNKAFLDMVVELSYSLENFVSQVEDVEGYSGSVGDAYKLANKARSIIAKIPGDVVVGIRV